jgi:hypothetical protein
LTLLSILTRWFRNSSTPPHPELMAAKNLIKAVDKGGIPLNPLKVNQIARDLGLEVAPSADMQNTIARIREALKRT